jgi:hypothetical protein
VKESDVSISTTNDTLEATTAVLPLVRDRLMRDAITMGQHVIAAPMVEEAAAQLLLGQQLSGLAALLL